MGAQKKSNLRTVLSEFMHDTEIKQEQIAEAVKVSQAAVSRWLQGSDIKGENLSRVLEYMGQEYRDRYYAMATGQPARPSNLVVEPVQVETGARRYPPMGYINAELDRVELHQPPVMLNGDGIGESLPDTWIEPNWNKENIVCLRVQGRLSDRYLDGAWVFVERGVPIDAIPDGADVIVQIQGRHGARQAIRRWRSAEQAILVDIHDANAIPVPHKRGMPVWGVVRRVVI